MIQKCKECLEEKELLEFYSHPKWKNWVLWRCKQCIKIWRKSEKERAMARNIDKKRIRPDWYQLKASQKFRKENPEKYRAHRLVNNYFKYSKASKPTHCFSCDILAKPIELHHNDYTKPNEVFPLCSLCHSGVHYWKIDLELKWKIILPF